MLMIYRDTGEFSQFLHMKGWTECDTYTFDREVWCSFIRSWSHLHHISSEGFIHFGERQVGAKLNPNNKKMAIEYDYPSHVACLYFAKNPQQTKLIAGKIWCWFWHHSFGWTTRANLQIGQSLSCSVQFGNDYHWNKKHTKDINTDSGVFFLSLDMLCLICYRVHNAPLLWVCTDWLPRVNASLAATSKRSCISVWNGGFQESWANIQVWLAHTCSKIWRPTWWHSSCCQQCNAHLQLFEKGWVWKKLQALRTAGENMAHNITRTNIEKEQRNTLHKPNQCGLWGRTLHLHNNFCWNSTILIFLSDFRQSFLATDNHT